MPPTLDTAQKVPPTLDTAQNIPATLVPPALDITRVLCSVFVCVLCSFGSADPLSVEPCCGRVGTWGRRVALADEAGRTRNSSAGRKGKNDNLDY